MNSVVDCSNCNGVEDLYFVTCGDPGSDFPGRTLVYCAHCRREKFTMIDISLPLSLLTPDIFRQLYVMGKTESDPATAIDIVFGRSERALQWELEAIIEGRRL